MAYTFNPFTGTFDNTGSTAMSTVSAQIAETLVAEVTNAESFNLNRGDVVYTFGATGDVMSVKLASNSGDSTSATTLGVVNETIIPNGIGTVTVGGRIEKMSFPHPFADGDALYLGNTPGTFTRVKPVAPQHGVYLGVVERANNGNGIAYIKVQNGYELNEIHDVLITTPLSGQLIRRNDSNTLWENTSGVVVTSQGDIYSSSIGYFEQGIEINSSSTDVTTLFVYENKIGVNTETPNKELTVIGGISATDSIFVSGAKVIVSDTTTVPAASSVENIITLTETDYDAISVKDSQTLYIVV